MDEIIRKRPIIHSPKKSPTTDQPVATMSAQQAAQKLGLSTTTIKRKIAAGEIQALQDERGHYRITEEALDRFIKIPKPRPIMGGVHGQNMDRPMSDHGPSNERPMSDQNHSPMSRPWTDRGPTMVSPHELTIYLKSELERANERIRVLEERNEKLQAEMLSLMHELKAAITEKGKPGLSAWFAKVRGFDR